MSKLEYGSPEYKEARARINSELKAAYAAIERAQKISDETGVMFDFELAYGMGGTYVPEVAQDKYNGTGWNPSSQSC